MIQTKMYAFTGIEIAEKIVKYFREYPPQGYGTQVKEIKFITLGRWVAIIERSASCD